MVYTVGLKTTISSRTYHFVNYHHIRGLNPNKSVWKCTLNEEALLFEKSFNNNSFQFKNRKKYTYNFLCQENLLKIIGISSNNRPEYICCFECDINVPVEEWHGYPYDHTYEKKQTIKLLIHGLNVD